MYKDKIITKSNGRFDKPEFYNIVTSINYTVFVRVRISQVKPAFL